MTGITLRTPAILGRSAFEQIFDQFFNDPTPMIKRSTEGYPLTDIYKDEEGNQIIEMALAGFSKEDLSIEIKENTIAISTVATAKREILPGLTRRIAKRSFSKKFIDYDNNLDLEKSTASFENGLLKITIPSQNNAETITIKIN